MNNKYLLLFLLFIGILLFTSPITATNNTESLDDTLINENFDNIVEEESPVNTNDMIIASDTSLYYKNGSGLIAKLVDYNNTPLINETLSININGATYYRTTDSEGMISLAINLNPDVYQTIIFTDSGLKNTINITVLSSLDSCDIVKYYRNDTQYYVTVFDNIGNPLAFTNITINIHGVFYKRTTDKDGIARLNINLNPGDYILTVTNDLNGEELSNNISILSTISGENIVKYFKNDTSYYVSLLDYEGNPLNNTDVTMNINGVFYTRRTNDEGIVSLAINLNPNTYLITITHPLSGLEISNEIEVLSILISEDLDMLYRDGTFKVKVLDNTGNLLTDTYITFNINGVFYNRLTDNDGIASLNINLDIGNYIITSTFNDYSTSNMIYVVSSYNSILSANDMYMIYGESRPFTVHLKNYRSNPISNSLISIQIDQYNILYDISGQDWSYEFIETTSYSAISDDSGNAYLDINPSQGYYVLTVSFAGDELNQGADSITSTISVVGLDGNSGRGNSVYGGESLSQYLLSSSTVQSSNQVIVNLAIALTANCLTNTEKAYAIFDYVASNIAYELYSGTKYGALRTLELKRGNCVDQARLIVALSRAAGLPARHVQGPNHVWAQILIPEQNIWLIADSTTQRCSKFGFWNIYSSGISYFV